MKEHRHSIYSLFDSLDANLGILRKEDKHLVCRIIIVGHQDGEVSAAGMTITGGAHWQVASQTVYDKLIQLNSSLIDLSLGVSTTSK